MDAIACPVCGTTDPDVFFEALGVPAFNNVLWPTRDTARAAPRGDIRLAACPTCAMVFNTAFDAATLEYSVEYDNSLHFSPTFTAYAEELADRLIEAFGLRGRTVVEVGCGKGEFLAMLCRAGGVHGVGFDESFDPATCLETGTGSLRVETGRWPAAADGLSPALVLARHVLEHIADPGPFLATLASAATRHPPGGVFIEVPNVLFSLRDLGVWDIIYEHVCYYAPESLATLMARTELEVTAMGCAYGDQFLWADARVAGRPEGVMAGIARRPADWDALVRRFASHHRDAVARWTERFGDLAAHGGHAVVWGAGSKGTSFVNAIPDVGAIAGLVDLNPRKQGRFAPGAGLEVMAPDAIRAVAPDLVLVMNPLYVTEVRARLEADGIRAPVEVV